MGLENVHSVPIAQRLQRGSWSQAAYGALFCILFDLGCLFVNLTQISFLVLLPFPSLYKRGITYTKGAFGCLLVLMIQIFSPTSFSITFETRPGQGAFSAEEIERIAVRDASGTIISLNLPQKHVLISNHQTYLDWWLAWCFAYLMKTHDYVFIVLKRSLKWLPVVGWGMQFFRFIFLARSWASDRLHLVTRLSLVARDAQDGDTPLCLVLYPEGTLVSKDTRPISQKYASKLGIAHMDHMLLPRSTGLLYSLRSLAPRVPSLRLIDITMIYPGIPPKGYGQDYYTLKSMFISGVSPPVVHVHLRVFDVATQVPIGNTSISNPEVLPSQNDASSTVEVDVPEEERSVFDLWLRNLWQEKDQCISRFHETGKFLPGAAKTAMVAPVKLRTSREILDSFCLYIPSYVWSRWEARPGSTNKAKERQD